MASSSDNIPSSSIAAADVTAAKAVVKRYEGLLTVRTKAIRGKGAWYWTHLEPILIKNPDTNLSKAVKLRCSLCDAVFSASNPSRTASEHLKRGTCPNFSADSSNNNLAVSSPLPISSLPSPPVENHVRKRSSQFFKPLNAVALVDSARFCNSGMSRNRNDHHNHQHQQHLMLSGGKDDVGALAMLEDSVKKLKSPGKSSPGSSLSKDRIDVALDLLSDWVYESCGSVSFSSLEHPKFKAFLGHVGLPCLSRKDWFFGDRLEGRFHEAKVAADARIRDAAFFQLVCNGWKRRDCCGGGGGEEGLIKFSVNVPNGISVFQKGVVIEGLGSVSPKYAEEVMWEALVGVCGGNGLQRCIGIVGDKYKCKSLRNLEMQYQWMVNVSCQVQGFVSLINDFSKELHLFRNVTEKCLKLANFVNNSSQFRSSFQKYRMQELECSGLIRVPRRQCGCCSKDFTAVCMMVEDIFSCSRVLQMVVLDEPCKMICAEDPVARDVSGMIQSEGFWTDLEAVYSLEKLIMGMAQEIEVERLLVGQCLPLWEELKAKVKCWCARFSIGEGQVEKIVERRFRKNYHPVWSAAFVLDPMYLIRDTSGKYLPPFKFLTNEQEKDVDKLITRLVPREEAHVALMELMKWRSEGLDPLYAQAVQVKQRDPSTGKMKIANPQGSRLVWETCLSEYKTLGRVAVRLIFLHATSCGFKCNWSFMKWLSSHRHSRVSLERAQKMIFIAAHAKVERCEFSNEEEKEGEVFRMPFGEDDMLNEVFIDAPSV